jgi:hypothetical protein
MRLGVPLVSRIAIEMTLLRRRTGIALVGDMPWGTHFCHFFETKRDLLDTVLPYLEAGLEAVMARRR